MTTPDGQNSPPSLDDIPDGTPPALSGFEAEKARLEKSKMFADNPRLHATHRAEEEFGRLIDEVKALRQRSTKLADDLFVSLPNAAKYKQAFDIMRGSSGWSTLVVAVGSGVISYAGTLGEGEAKLVSRWAGVVLAAAGVLWALWSLIGIKVSKD